MNEVQDKLQFENKKYNNSNICCLFMIRTIYDSYKKKRYTGKLFVNKLNHCTVSECSIQLKENIGFIFA